MPRRTCVRVPACVCVCVRVHVSGALSSGVIRFISAAVGRRGRPSVARLARCRPVSPESRWRSLQCLFPPSASLHPSSHPPPPPLPPPPCLPRSLYPSIPPLLPLLLTPLPLQPPPPFIFYFQTLSLPSVCHFLFVFVSSSSRRPRCPPHPFPTPDGQVGRPPRPPQGYMRRRKCRGCDSVPRPPS